MTDMLAMVGASFLFIMAMMTILWLVYFFQRNATVVDLGWSASFLVAIWSYFLLGYGYLPRRIMLTLMVTLWAGRLLGYLWMRFRKEKEDPRYTKLRERLGQENSEFKFFIMFIVQGLVVLFLTLPFLLSSIDTEGWSGWQFWGFLIWAAGVAGETISDSQRMQFFKKKENSGKVCDVGFWGYSRHPNYFFEWVVWIGFAVYALDAPFGWLGLSAPFLMYYLLNFVTGIPPAEQLALETKGDAYRRYMEKTSSFFIWFKK